MTDLPLLPHHKALLDASGVSPEVAEARGYRSITTRAELARLGFGRKQLIVPTLLIPVWSVTGERASYQHRPDNPRVINGKPLKYETPKGSRMLLDVHPFARLQLGDPSIPLFITEGVRKGDAAVSRGLCCVALLGVWNWRGSNERGGKTALPDWEYVALNGRRVFIVFDSDVMLKAPVHQALARLKSFLEQRGADVALIYLPAGDGGAKVGLDDYLASGRTIEDLLGLATRELRDSPKTNPDYVQVGEYLTDGRKTYRWKQIEGEGYQIPLCNFSAQIVEEVVRDDGAERKTAFRIAGRLFDGSPLPTVEVLAESYPGMNWVTSAWGSRPVVYAGQGTKDHLRAAIQLLSGDVPRRIIFAHVGWRQIDGEWVYLHAGGGINRYGLAPGVEVELDGALANMELPEPPEGDHLREAVEASLQVLNVAPLKISAPLLAAVYRAPLCEVLPADFSLFYAGPTGVKKTSLAALAQAHFGKQFSDRQLPANWATTANSLELLAFLAKDAVLVVDDFTPGGEPREVQRTHREADRILRAQANRAGRGRMRPDGSLRPVYTPRGLILSNGEDTPTGESLRARLFIINVGPNDVNLEALTRSQRDAADGQLASAMAGYVRWLAPQLDSLRELLRQRKLELRAALRQENWFHDRTPDILASLLLGWDTFLSYAVAAKALRKEEGETIWRAGFEAMLEEAREQASYIADEDPVNRFLYLLQSLLDSGRAHLAGVTDEEGVSLGKGERIGWNTGAYLYLDPDLAYAHVQRLAREQGVSLPVTPRTLWKRMHERGLLEVEQDHNQIYYTPKRTVGGKRRRVLVIRVSSIEGGSPQGHPQGSSGNPGEPAHQQPYNISPQNMGIMGNMGGGPSGAGFRPLFAPMLAPETWALPTQNMGTPVNGAPEGARVEPSAHVSTGERPCFEPKHGRKTSAQTIDTTGFCLSAHDAHVLETYKPIGVGERAHPSRRGRRRKGEEHLNPFQYPTIKVLDPTALENPEVRAFVENFQNIKPGELPANVRFIQSPDELPDLEGTVSEQEEEDVEW